MKTKSNGTKKQRFTAKQVFDYVAAEQPKNGTQYVIQSVTTVALGAGLLYLGKMISDKTGLSDALGNASSKAMGLVGFGDKKEENQQPQMRIVSNQ